MTASFASSARPPHAAIAWVTRDGLYVEVPCKDGPPFICRYHKTEVGLQAALNVLLENPETETRTVAREHPKIKYGPKTSFTDDQRQGVREVLKALKIT